MRNRIFNTGKMKKSGKALPLALLTACMASAFSMTAACSITAAAAPEDLFACSTSRNSDNNIVVDFKEVQLTLPASWSGKCQVTTSANSASFYQTKSRKLWSQELGYSNGGLLFEICYSENLDFLEYPAYRIIGDTDEGHYYVEYPTDVQAYVDNEEAANEFWVMSDDVQWISDTITIKPEYQKAETDFANDEDYILPQSSTAYLTTEDLKTLTGDEIQMAINEIYARHHRKFVVKKVQDYFNEKSWYEGYVEASEFSTDVMNDYEAQNIGLMVKYMKDNGITSSF